MRGFPIIPTKRPSHNLAGTGKQPGRLSLCFFIFCVVITAIVTGGCSPLNGGALVRTDFNEADAFFNQGNYQASIGKYEQIIEKNPATADRALFEMGIIHAHPKNMQNDYGKALECFQKLINDYPESDYRHDSDMMLFYINNVIIKDEFIAKKQAQIEGLQQELKTRATELGSLQQQIEVLKQKFFAFAMQAGPVDKILVEKEARTLKLISKGEVIKTYKIALGGNPTGPKERQGDNKTPEGTYSIVSRNKESSFHLSLRISYPNESDRRRANELGVSPGGDIMIHGIKNGFSWVGDYHTEVDWTKGCIAVTDEEIEEIDQLAPNGTIVEIRP